MIWQNSEIKIEGAQIVYACFESVFTLTFGTATYIDVTYHTSLGIGTTRYYPDASGEAHVPFGDLARALTEQGINGSVAIFDAVDDVDGTAVTVTVNLLAGYVPRSQEGIYPPTKLHIYASQPLCWAFEPIGVWPQPYTIEQSFDGGVTWSTVSNGTTDGVLSATITTSTARLVRVLLTSSNIERWRGEVAQTICGATIYVEWLADDQTNKLSWLFEVLEVSRNVTDTRTLDDNTYYGGTFFKQKKCWKMSVKAIVRGLVESECRYFDSLPTSEITNITTNEDATMVWVIPYMQGQPCAGTCTDKKVTRHPNSTARYDLTFTFDLYTFKTF